MESGRAIHRDNRPSLDLEFYEPGLAWEDRLTDLLAPAGDRRASLAGPLRAIVREMLQNAIKTMYKKLYFEENHGKSLEDFRQAVGDEGTVALLAEQARKRKMSALLSARDRGSFLRVVVSNEGVPDANETQRIGKSLEAAGERKAIRRLFESSETDDPNQEGGGIGIELVVSLLSALGISQKSFQIYALGSRTYSRVHFPFTLNSSRETSDAS